MKVVTSFRRFAFFVAFIAAASSCQLFRGSSDKPAQIEFRLVDPSGAAKGPVMKIENGGMGIPLAPQPVVTTADIRSAQAKVAPDGNLYVEIDLNDAGALKLGTFTARHRGSRLGIVVNGDLLTMPVIKGTMQGHVSFNVQLAAEKARAFARSINDGLEK